MTGVQTCALPISEKRFERGDEIDGKLPKIREDDGGDKVVEQRSGESFGRDWKNAEGGGKKVCQKKS